MRGLYRGDACDPIPWRGDSIDARGIATPGPGTHGAQDARAPESWPEVEISLVMRDIRAGSPAFRALPLQLIIGTGFARRRFRSTHDESRSIPRVHVARLRMHHRPVP